jgi:hypothetical protein
MKINSRWINYLNKGNYKMLEENMKKLREILRTQNNIQRKKQ